MKSSREIIFQSETRGDILGTCQNMVRRMGINLRIDAMKAQSSGVDIFRGCFPEEHENNERALNRHSNSVIGQTAKVTVLLQERASAHEPATATIEFFGHLEDDCSFLLRLVLEFRPIDHDSCLIGYTVSPANGEPNEAEFKRITDD